MTRDETVALFLECEAKRAEALAAGKSKYEAHEKAEEHWNAWAKKILAQREALEKEGRWEVEARADFSGCVFILTAFKGTEGTPEENKGQPEGGELPAKSMAIDGRTVDFRGFVFPGDASFDSATFSGDASFDTATFSGGAYFYKATFEAIARFHSAIFEGMASFTGATFKGYARFDSATFKSRALFDRASFEGDVSFARDARTTEFLGNASFANASFPKSASFRNAKFGSKDKKTGADFTAIKVERAFDLTGVYFFMRSSGILTRNGVPNGETAR